MTPFLSYIRRALRARFLRTSASWMIGALIVSCGTAGLRAAPITFDDFFALVRVSDPQISPDGKQVAFVATTYDKAKNNSNSDIYLVSIDGKNMLKLTNSPKGDSQPRFSPDGRKIAFVSSRSGTRQIWIIPVTGGEAKQLTTLSTGASGPLWTPDGKQIFFTSDVYPDCPDDDCNAKRLDDEEKRTVQARVIDDLFFRHWDSWRSERRSHVFVVSAGGGTPRDLTPGSLDVPTIALGSNQDYAVSPEGKEICVVANTDKMQAISTNNDLFIISLERPPAGGETFPAFARRLTSNPADDNCPVYSPDGRYIAYRAMARPGFESDRYRLVLYDRKKNDFIDVGDQLANSFDRSVGSITWSPGSKKILVTCDDGGYSSVYSIDIDKHRVEQLTEKKCISSPTLSPDGKNAVCLMQNAAMPYEVFAADKSFGAGRMRNISNMNRDALARLDMNRLEEFHFSGAGGTPVQGFLLKPPGFEEGKKYPLIFLIHGGPQGAWDDIFHWRWNYQMFAAPGYVVAAVNPRGSTGFGQKFTDEISGDWGGKVFEDLMKGLDYVLSQYTFIDADRVAAAGASYGGYMINWIEGHNDDGKFKCLVNHDGTYNLVSMYGETEELWFPEWDLGGTPWDNPEGYARFSPHTYAKNFKTPMLIIHGELDFRLPVSEGLQAFTALKRQGVPARFLYFPDEGHWVQKPQNAELWWKTVHEWIAEWLK
jgi:dipeptidyl aminopeptidase/acylaminoacyl peptidase